MAGARSQRKLDTSGPVVQVPRRQFDRLVASNAPEKAPGLRRMVAQYNERRR